MRERYIAIFNRHRGGDARHGVEEAARTAKLDLAFSNGPLAVFSSERFQPTAIPKSGGIILGCVFDRAGETRVPDTSRLVLGERGADATSHELISQFWGGYVAFLCGPSGETASILRDPSGLISCYVVEAEDVIAIASDADLLAAAGLTSHGIDADAVAHQLLYQDLRVRRTCLRGVTELLPGERLDIDQAGMATVECWTPWTFATRASEISSFDEAKARVRTEVQRCVAAWAETTCRPLIELSGGLDSSVVALCFPNPETIDLINLVPPGGDGDERRYAEVIADMVQRPLISRGLSADAVDLAATQTVRLPRFGAHPIQRRADQVIAEVARESKSDALISGGGGDNVFCFLNTAGGPADALIAHGAGSSFWRASGDLATVFSSPIWKAAWLGVRKAFRRRGRVWAKDEMFIGPEFVGVPLECHPWLKAPQNALPGKVDHIKSLLVFQGSEHLERTDVAPMRFPLFSQPLIELCLKIPTWHWMRGGRNRAVVRSAFSDQLPSLVRNRTTKGGLASLFGAAFGAYREPMRDCLLDGVLARRRIIDSRAVDAYFRQRTVRFDAPFYRVFDLIGAELWARSWEP